MAYFSGLEKKILENHLNYDADELIILSGYISPIPIVSLSRKPLKSKIIWGTLKEDKRSFSVGIHKIYKMITSDSTSNSEVFYKKSYDHSKIYCWLKDGQPVQILAGSANFTNRGLRGHNRESLFDVDASKYAEVHKYLKSALSDSSLCTSSASPTPYIISSASKSAISDSSSTLDQVLSVSPPSAEIYLGGTGRKMYPKSGLNWGHGKANNRIEDGELRLRIELVRDQIPGLFPNNGININYGKGQSHRNIGKNAEIVFDDGHVMDASFEGHNPSDGKSYFKQLSSFSGKKAFGIYFRDRLGLPHNHKITDRDLKKYGRETITLTLISEGLYEADFSRP